LPVSTCHALLGTRPKFLSALKTVRRPHGGNRTDNKFFLETHLKRIWYIFPRLPCRRNNRFDGLNLPVSSYFLIFCEGGAFPTLMFILSAYFKVENLRDIAIFMVVNFVCHIH
jgi:hypothetical protein